MRNYFLYRLIFLLSFSMGVTFVGCTAIQDTVCETPPPTPTEGEAPPTAEGETPTPTEGEAPAPEEGEEPPVEPKPIVYYTYNVVAQYPHDPDAFTQGLQYVDGEMFEGTGLRGMSSLRRVKLETGEVLQQTDLDKIYFGEGITVMGEKIFQLTWQSKKGFVYRKDNFALITEFTYATEGWGLTHDGTKLIMSDGTANLYFLDPVSFAKLGQVEVRGDAGPINRLNELEYIKGEVYANVWQTNAILIINPATGRVTGAIDLKGLLSPDYRTGQEDVLNGIAYDESGDRLFVTGKKWPLMFEIDLVETK